MRGVALKAVQELLGQRDPLEGPEVVFERNRGL